MYIRLEYSQTQGHFHFASLSEAEQSNNDYRVLCNRIQQERAERFCCLTQEKYPDLNSGNTHNCPTFLTLAIEFFRFIRQEIDELEQSMKQTYFQRKSLSIDCLSDSAIGSH